MRATREKLNEKGITLVALVITIVVLLILAGVSLKNVAGPNGIIAKAKEARDKTAEAARNDEIAIQEMENWLSSEWSDSNNPDNPENPDNPDNPNKPPVFTTVANEPDISNFNQNSTYYTLWMKDEEDSNLYNIRDTIAISEQAPEGWYDYTAGENKWANVKTTGGGNDCYWVWIPRYAYKVPARSSNAQTIEVAFLKGVGRTTNDIIDEAKKEEIETAGGFSITPTPGNWVIHPAFTNAGNGGFGELKGIWVAKFEASSDSTKVVENPTIAELAIDGGSAADTDLKVRVKPNVTSWRNITVGNMFTVCQNLLAEGNSLEGAENLAPHLMKNSEWGAVAYLSRSVYGKNGQVWNNPFYNNSTNYSPITGRCGIAPDGSQTNFNQLYKYNEIGGTNASTSGTVYGVYDMAGGAWEYVASVRSANLSNGSNYNFTNVNPKYYETYNGYNSEKYGDAVYETSTSGSEGSTTSWDKDYSIFVTSTTPVFVRGGRAHYGSGAGVFAFGDGTGGAYTFYSFRPCVVSGQP